MKRYLNAAAVLAASALLLVGCGTTPSASPTAPVSWATPATKPPTAPPVAKTAAAPPTATLMASNQPFDLTILHTNDVKGYLEPCG